MTLTLPGDFTPGVTQIIGSASSADTSVATVGSLSAWQGDNVAGGTLTSSVQVTPQGTGETTITVSVQVGIIPTLVTKTATIAVSVS